VDAFRGLSDMAIGFFGNGATSVLRKQNNIPGALAVYGSAVTGASSLVFSTAGTSGDLSHGSVFGIQGLAGAYTLAAMASAANGHVAVTFTPPLAGDVVDGAVVTFSQAYGEFTYPRMNGKQEQDTDRGVRDSALVRVLAYQAGKPAPVESDLLDSLPITKVEPVDAGGGVSRYRVTVNAP
jgi:hypothetical protein